MQSALIQTEYSQPCHPIYIAQKNTPIKSEPAAADAGALNKLAPPEYTGASAVSEGLLVDDASVEEEVEVAVVEAGVESSQFQNHLYILFKSWR